MSDGPVQNPDTPEQLWRRLEDERDWWRQRAAKLEGEAEHLSLQLEDTKRESTRYREHAEAALARSAEALRKAEEEREEYRATAELLASRVRVLEKDLLDLEQRFAASQLEVKRLADEKQATFDRLNAELIEEQRYGDDVRQGRDRALVEKGAAVEAEREACAQTVEHAARQQEARARRLQPSEADLRGLASAIRARGGKS